MADWLDFEIDVELETGLITGNAGVWQLARLGSPFDVPEFLHTLRKNAQHAA